MIEKTETLIYEITTRCNLRCLHCGYWRSEPNDCILEEYEQTLLFGTRLGAKNILLTGGEPSMHPLFHNLVEIAKKLNLKVKVASNGIDLSKDFLEKTFSYIDELVISLDATTDDVYKKIRGRNAYGQLLKNISNIVRCKRSGQTIKLSFLIQKTNFCQLPEYVEAANKLKVDSVSILVPNSRGDFQRSLGYDDYASTTFLDINEKKLFQEFIFPKFESKYHQYNSLFLFGDRHLYSIREYILNDGKCTERGLRTKLCGLPMTTLFVYADGRARLCPYFENGYTELSASAISNNRLDLLFRGNCACSNCLEVPIGMES